MDAIRVGRPRAGAPVAGTPDGVDLVRMLDAMPAAFCLLDREWRFRYINAQAERLMGRPRDEFLGRTVAETFPETIGSVFDDAFRTAMRSGEPVSFEAASPSAGGRRALVRGARLAGARRSGRLLPRRHRPRPGGGGRRGGRPRARPCSRR